MSPQVLCGAECVAIGIDFGCRDDMAGVSFRAPDGPTRFESVCMPARDVGAWIESLGDGGAGRGSLEEEEAV